jgi:ABC-2 type transport system permease protein
MLRDIGLVFRYEIRRTLRSPAWVIFGVVQPVLWLVLFAPLLQRVLPGAALPTFVPGVLVMITLYGSLYVGFGLVAMLRTGVTERLMVTPASRVALLLGLVSLVTVGGAAVSYALALSLRDENALAQTVGSITMPLLLLSGILVPFSLAPGWLRGLGHASPFYYVVEAGRALLRGDYTAWHVPVSYALTLALAALAMAWATAAIRRAAG